MFFTRKFVFTLALVFTTLWNPIYAQQYQLSSKNKKALKFYGQAETAFRTRENASAQVALLKAVKADKDFIEAWLLLGDVNTELRNFEDAATAFETAIKIDSSFFPRAYIFAGNLNYTLGRYSEAAAFYKLYLSKFGSENLSGEKAKSGLAKAEFARFAIQKPVCEEPVNLGTEINTPEEDYPNFIDPSGKQLVLTRKTFILFDAVGRPIYLEKLYASKMENDRWEKPDTLLMHWDQGINIGGMNMSVDGRKMYFTGCNWPSSYGSCDIYVSFRKGKFWQSPFNLGGKINSQWWDSQPMVSADSRQLYFASKRANGKGGSDIWMSLKLKDGKWSPPINLGDSINTPGNEMAPMLHPDGKTLYFSSDGHTGLGQSDLYFSRKDETGRWSKAQNLGYPINSRYNEINMFIDLEGKQALFSSDRPGGYGKTDIYTFKVYPEMAPGKVSFVKGSVTDKEFGQPISAQVVLTDLTTGNLKDSTLSDPVTGEFLMVLQPKINYAFNITAKGYLLYSENFNLSDSLSAKPIEKVFKLSPLKKGESFILQNVFFDFNSSQLKPESFGELNKLTRLLQSNPDLRIKIEGHTDNIGNADYNLTLSEERAEAVFSYLLEKGIPETTMQFEGFGATKPLRSNDTEEGRAKNRRTEVTVL